MGYCILDFWIFDFWNSPLRDFWIFGFWILGFVFFGVLGFWECWILVFVAPLAFIKLPCGAVGGRKKKETDGGSEGI